MGDYSITIETKSYCLPGSGEGWGSVIDTDISFDEIGLPLFPARRLKGCLRESALEILEMLQSAGLKKLNDCVVDRVFGSPGDDEGAKAVFNNLYIADYEGIAPWLRWGFQEFNGLISPDTVLSAFTCIRQQTSISQDGIAEDGSLRTFRVLKPGITFIGDLTLKEDNPDDLNLIALACANLRSVGSMRNRGYGRVKCVLGNVRTGVDLSDKAIEDLKKEAV
ncbi:MAG: hypothetical protein GX352_02385 [Clostridiales bacterium]|nr:hypothetical protein [Clostridiales bacterium]